MVRRPVAGTRATAVGGGVGTRLAWTSTTRMTKQPRIRRQGLSNRLLDSEIPDSGFELAFVVVVVVVVVVVAVVVVVLVVLVVVLVVVVLVVVVVVVLIVVVVVVLGGADFSGF